MHQDLPQGLAEALVNADILGMVVDSAGRVLTVTGSFAPDVEPAGMLTDVLGPEVLDGELMSALIEALTLHSGADAEISIGGIPCHAICTPIEGVLDQSLILIVPDYRRGRSGAPDSAPGPRGCDVRAIMGEVRRRMERLGSRGNEVFAWSEDEPLEVGIDRATVIRLVDILLEAPFATLQFDGTAVITARRDHTRDDSVILRMRVYDVQPRPSVLRALETVYAEFSATTRIPIEMSQTGSQLDIMATLRRAPGSGTASSIAQIGGISSARLA